MVAKGGRRRDNKNSDKENSDTRQSDSSDEDDDSDEELEEEAPPLKFVLAGDDTGSGIDYNVLDEDSWQTLEEYCKKWGLKQAHLESIYSRFARTIARKEHLDFTFKPQFHASLDFLADEFMTTAGEFAAQFFIQTWFLRRKRGLKPPKDRRCVDFTRLVIMCCDLARLGDYELLTNLWACVLHRFGGILPKGTVNLDTRLNTELVKEVITVLHTSTDKKLDLVIGMLLAESEELDDLDRLKGAKSMERKDAGNGEGQDDESMEESGRKTTRYLTLRSVLRFSFQHPPLLFPVVQFQRVLRSKIIGSRYWLRRRKPASDRGLSIQDSLGLPSTYHDIFDRVESRRQAWIVASGHILLHALDPPPHMATAAAAAAAPSAQLCDNQSGAGQRGGRGEGRAEGRGGGDGIDGVERAQRYNERCRQLLDNCVPPPWYEVGEKAAASASTVIGAVVGGKMMPALTGALTRFKANAKTLASPKSAPTSPFGGAPSATKSGEETNAFDTGTALPGAPLSDRSHSGRSRSRSGHGSPNRSRRSRSHTPASTIPAATAGPTPAPGTKTCAVCLLRSSPVALCRKCGRRAVKALKDDLGSRQARALLVPYGAFFGVAETSALQREGDAVKRWVRLLDDETGADFYYNAHYDSAVWKSGIEPPKPAPVVKIARRRKMVGSGGPVVVASPPLSGGSISPPASPVAPLSAKRTNEGAASAPMVTGMAAAAAAVASAGSTGRTALLKTRTMFSAASMAALQAAAGGGGTGSKAPDGGGANDGPRTTTPPIKPALKPPASPSPSSPLKNAAAASGAGAASPGNRVVLLTKGDSEVVLDAHKRIYPPFRLVSWEDAEKAAAAAAGGTPSGMEGVSPGPSLGLRRKSYSRGGSVTPVDSAGGRTSSPSRAGTAKRAGTMARAGAMMAGAMSAAGATTAAAT